MNELNEIVEKYKKGDEKAFEKILKEMQKVITKAAIKYKSFFPVADIDELTSEGTYGLFQAIKHFNSEKNLQFSTYAQFWINKYIKQYITNIYRVVPIPYEVQKTIKKIYNLLDKYQNLSIEEISKKLNIEPDKVKDFLAIEPSTKKELSLDKYLDESEQQETLYEILADSSQKTPMETLHREEIKNYVDVLLSKLSNDEAEVIRWRFGLKDNKHHTIKSVSEKLNLTVQKVKEIEEIALQKLKGIANELNQDISSR